MGKRRRIYRSADIRTSYDALKALPEAGSYRDDVRRVGSGGVRTDRPSGGAGTAKDSPDALREAACGGALKAAAAGSPFRAGAMKDRRVFRHITVNAEAQIMGFPDTLQTREHGSRSQLSPRLQRLPACFDGAIHGIFLSPRRSIARAVVRWWLNCALGLALSGAALRAAEEVPRGSASRWTKDDSQATVDEESRPAADAAVAATPSAGIAWPLGACMGIYLSFRSAASDRRVGAVTNLGCGHRAEAAGQCCFAEPSNIATAIAVGTPRWRSE